MIIRSFVRNFILFSLIIVIADCRRETKKLQSNKDEAIRLNSLQYDTSEVTVLPFTESNHYPFDEDYTSTTLTANEIVEIENIFRKCVSEYNGSLDQAHHEYSIDLGQITYKKQLVPVKNLKGETLVWVNCLCRVRNESWKNKLQSVDDGGKCYFNFKINLRTKEYFDLVVNGEA